MKFLYPSHYIVFSLLFLLLLVGCGTPHRRVREDSSPLRCRSLDPSLSLTAIHLVDRNGTVETISNPDRLQVYEKVDFLAAQPYGKVLRIFGRPGLGKVYAFVTSYYENGQVRQYLEVVDNRARGFYREWHENGQLRLEAIVIGGDPDIAPSAESSWLFDGRSRFWDDEGKLRAEICYAKGKLEGQTLHYHANGQLWKKGNFSSGKLDGSCEIFYSDGSLLLQIPYKEGEADGRATRYWHSGQISAEEEFVKGKLLQSRYWDSEGNLVASIDAGEGFRALFGESAVVELRAYHGGIEEGEIRKLNNAGQLVRVWHVKEGCKHGEEVEYYPESGRQKMEVHWVEGHLQGIAKTWYPGGSQQSQREMSHNMKNGMLIAWYADGSLMLVEEYEKDLLRRGEYYRQGEKVPVAEVTDGEGIAYLYTEEGDLSYKVTYRQGKPMTVGSLAF